jgi:hypothetical protein
MNQRGHAVFLVLLLLLLFGALSALALASARFRLTGGQSETERSQAILLAEGDVNRQFGQWDPLLAETLTVGGRAPLPGSLPPSGMTVADSLERLGQGLYWVGATVERRSNAGMLQARERMGQLVVRTAPTLREDASIVGGGLVSVQATAVADGADANVAGWGALCPPPAAPGASVVLGPAGRVDPAGCSGPPCLSGVPLIGLDTSLATGWLQRLGAVPLDSLIAHADQRLSGLVVGAGPVRRANGSCDLTAPGNLGDPAGPAQACGSYLAISVAAVGTELRDGVGQGLLIGQGSLVLSGSFQFTGQVVVRGSLTLRDQVRLVGSVVVTDSVTLLGSSQVQRSTCAVRRAGRGAARPFFPVARRWFRTP